MMFNDSEPGGNVGTVPKGRVVLTADVDAQKYRIEVEIVKFGSDKQSWSGDRVFDGAPAGLMFGMSWKLF